MSQLLQILTALGSGILMGAIFTLLKLPLPAPNARAGIAGIAGIFIGSLLVGLFIKK
ncbi:MAG: XapX domain-containing protein [Candidatus Absconditicoccaceae bacterium]|jgi:hypothetical protein